MILALGLACLFATTVVSPVVALNPYAGGNFTNSEASATKGYFSTDFAGTTASSIPSGHSLLTVLSVAGETTSSPCPCGYQSAYVLFPNGTVDYAPQYWGTSGLVSLVDRHVGTVSSISFGGLIRYDSSTSSMKFTGFVYNTHTQIDQNTPTIYNILSANTGDTNFYYGTTTSQGVTLKTFQFAVESQVNITSSMWNVDQGTLEVYTSSWGYQPGSSLEGGSSTSAYALVCGFLCLSYTVYYWGGETFKGVNLATSPPTADAPSWAYTGTSIGTGTSLWTGTGSYTPYPCQVSGRC